MATYLQIHSTLICKIVHETVLCILPQAETCTVVPVAGQLPEFASNDGFWPGSAGAPLRGYQKVDAVQVLLSFLVLLAEVLPLQAAAAD